MATPGHINTDAVITQVKRLLNTQLKTVLKACNLPVSGAKATLQQRIIAYIHACAKNDTEGFNRIRHLVFHPEQESSGSPYTPSPTARTFPTESSRQAHTPYQHQAASVAVRPPMSGASGPALPRVPDFKPSPFYSIIQALTSVLEIKVREQTRDNVQAFITLRDDIAARLNSDPTIRVMVFCAAESISSPFQRVDIAFPYQIEIRVNQDEVKANLRGLKNKPGSTRPADITNYIRKRAGYENHLQVTYALTTKKFFLVANLVRQQPVSELVARLKSSNKKISKERVIGEMKSRAEDSDIVATSSILSLKCPLSTLRMEVPCRSISCNHNQCFDATSFLQLQEQAPTWTCPICNKPVIFEHLELDQYVDDILQSTPKSLDQVTIEPDGKWSRVAENASSPGPSGVRSGSASDSEELVEIKDASYLAGISRESNFEASSIESPAASSRAISTSSAMPVISSSSGGNKRSSSQVVDLTLSSDDEEIVDRAPKRQVTHRPSSNFAPRDSVGLAPNGINGIVHNTNRQQHPLPHLLNPGYDSRGYPQPF